MSLRLFLFLSAIFTLLSCQGPARAPAAEEDKWHIVFDLDWTLVSPLKEGEAPNATQVLDVRGERYRLHDGVVDLLAKLKDHPNIEISFFSGGPRERNIALLSEIKLPGANGESALDIAYKVLSFDDLTDLSAQVPVGARFSERYKKDLRKVSTDLKNIVMIEDNHWFALGEEQAANVKWLGKTFLHFETTFDLQIGLKELAGSAYLPSDYAAWGFHRNKMLVLTALFNEALEHAEEEGFANAISRLWSEYEIESGQWSERAQSALRKSKTKIRAPLGDSCDELISSLFLRAL
jgi:hypothetical protein